MLYFKFVLQKYLKQYYQKEVEKNSYIKSSLYLYRGLGPSGSPATAGQRILFTFQHLAL